MHLASRDDEDDLDRTDELPQLDVDAYEAALRTAADEHDTAQTGDWPSPALSQIESEAGYPDARRGEQAQPEATKEQLGVELDAIREKIAALESQLDDAQDRNASLNERCAELENQVAATNADLAAERQRSGGIERQLAQANAELSEARHQLGAAAEAQRALKAQIDEQAAVPAQLSQYLAGQIAQTNALSVQLTRQTDCVAALERELSSTREVLQAREASLRESRSLVSDLQCKLDGAMAELEPMGDLERQLRQTHERIEAQDAELGQARDELGRSREALDERNAQIEQLKAELVAHVNALGAIRHDVSRVAEHHPIDGAPEEGAAPARALIPADGEGVTHLLTRKVMTLGRTSANDIQIDSKLVSRHHARLLIGPTAVVIEDLHSVNGCYVNGRRVRKHVLHVGDVLTIADKQFRVASGDA